MAYFRKTPSGWRAEVVRRCVRDSALFHTKDEAQQWATQREAELGVFRPPARWLTSRLMLL